MKEKVSGKMLCHSPSSLLSDCTTFCTFAKHLTNLIKCEYEPDAKMLTGQWIRANILKLLSVSQKIDTPLNIVGLGSSVG